MKPFLMIFALIVMAAPVTAATFGELKPGDPAPGFTLKDVDGREHNLNDYLGKIVILEWTNHECPYVVKHYETGNMQKLQEQTTANEDTIWLTIVSSAPGKQGHTSPEEAKMIIEEAGAKATARLFDPSGDVGRKYGAQTTPHMYVIDKEGKLAYMGAIDDNPSARHSTVETAKNYVSAALGAVMEGRTPEIAQTKPYGCSVKYSAL